MTLVELHHTFAPCYHSPGFAEAFAELLDYHFHLPALAIWTRPGTILETERCQQFQTDIARFQNDTPLAHLTGRCFFYGLSFVVTPDVLLPRPDSECLIRQALSASPTALTCLDIGTGSGILAICLAKHLPQSKVMATDISAAALTVAKQNGLRHGLSEHISWHHADLFPEKKFCPANGFEMIVSNPPYIAQSEWPDLAGSVRDHEPTTALLAGTDGLDFYRRIIPLAIDFLAPAGRLLLEVGYTQAESVSCLLAKYGYDEIRSHADYAGILRVISAIKR